MDSLEVGIIVKTLFVIPIVIACYLRGWYDFALPNRLKSKHHRKPNIKVHLEGDKITFK